MAAPGDGEDQKCLNKHGFPPGIRFVPEDHELLAILDDKRRGSPLAPSSEAIFHDTQILDFHPAKLYEMYAEDEQEGYIYFFSTIQFRGKKMVERAAKGGQWKGHNSKTVEAGGVAVGRKISMHFDDHSGDNDPVGTNWGMQEFARFIGPENELADLAVYRLYKMKIIKKDGEKTEDLAAADPESMNKRRRREASAAAMALPPSTPAPGLPGTMMFMADQANVASTSQAYAPQSSMWQLQQEGHQFANGAAAAAPSPSGCGPWAPPIAAEPFNYWAPPTPSAVEVEPCNFWARESAATPAAAANSHISPPPPPPPPLLQGSEYYSGYGAFGFGNMWRNAQQGSSSVAAAPAVLDVVPGGGDDELGQLPLGYEESHAVLQFEGRDGYGLAGGDVTSAGGAGEGVSQFQYGSSNQQQDPPSY